MFVVLALIVRKATWKEAPYGRALSQYLGLEPLHMDHFWPRSYDSLGGRCMVLSLWTTSEDTLPCFCFGPNIDFRYIQEFIQVTNVNSKWISWQHEATMAPSSRTTL